LSLRSSAAAGPFEAPLAGDLHFDSYLIVPTATMAEHTAHELARRGLPVRPSRVCTLARFLDARAALWKLPPEAPPALLDILLQESLEDMRPPRFQNLIGSRGLRAALVDLLQEIPAQAEIPAELAAIFTNVRENLDTRGFALRGERLRVAAARVREGVDGIPARVIFKGFFTLGPAEEEFIAALASRARVKVEAFEAPVAGPPQSVFSAATAEREAEEIARRILEYRERGHRFCEIGIFLRSRDPYGGIVETALAGFGIPYRPYFADPLASHPAIAFLSQIVRALLDGWDHAGLLRALRMPVSGAGATPSGDRFDFALREALPGKGLASLEPIPERPGIVAEFAALERWRAERNDPETWAARLKTLTRLLPPPIVPETTVDRDHIRVWRSTAAAIRAFEETAARTAAFLPAESMPLSRFWPYIETAFESAVLRVEDRRRDVVHILDVFEARQWSLPIVFVCGLLERTFPLYHREDPLVGDFLRSRLGLSTAAQRQQQERLLFQLATTRASKETILSYPRFNEKGEETIPSFFLPDISETPSRSPVGHDRGAAKDVHAGSPPHKSESIRDPVLTAQLAKSHRKLSPTGIESFLQCPFQFFARRTLGLRPRPPAPRDRLTILAQGQIIHRALAEWIHLPLLGSQVLNRVFQEECARLRVPETYRAEAVRLELMRNFEGFINNRQLDLGWNTEVERDFRFALSPELTIRGRIDRLDAGPRGEALVIDYKYSAGNKIRERVDESESGNLVQAGLYMLSVERAFGLKPIGMLYCGVKKEISWGGWSLAAAALERMGESRTQEGLRELMDEAARRATEAHAAISSGEIAVRPLDSKKCLWCDYRDACRIEMIGAEAPPAKVGNPA
jgi:ATP-dependent helicase/DNAse subunit B